MYSSWPTKPYHFHTDLIWCDSTFKYVVFQSSRVLTIPDKRCRRGLLFHYELLCTVKNKFRKYCISNLWHGGYLKAVLKGTVRPDWICMRVVPLDRPWKEHQPLYFFDFLIWLWNIWKDFKVLSRFIHNWIQLPACSNGLRFAYNPFFLLASARLFDEKISQSVALFWFGLHDVRVS
jgi:hypothetical protein